MTMVKLKKYDIENLNINKVVFFYEFFQTPVLAIHPRFHKKIEWIKFFTKPKNFNKLYVNSNKGIFLSPGIVLRFVKALSKKFLKKKHKCWIGAVHALKILAIHPTIITFDNLFGKKFYLLEKLLKRKTKINIIWIFIKFFYLHFQPNTKPKSRIKRWIKKKYFQLSVNEK